MPAILSLVIIGFVFLVYYKTFKFGLIVDDEKHYANVKARKVWKKFGLKQIIKRLYGVGTLAREIPCPDCKGLRLNCPVCEKTNGKILHVDIKQEHILTTALHALTCVLIYHAFGRDIVSFYAALLYAVNPINNQTSIWLNGRRYQVNIILVLSMLLIGKFGLILYPLTLPLQVNAFFAPVLFGPLTALLIPIGYLLAKKEIGRKIASRTKILYSPEILYFHVKKLIVIVKVYGLYFFHMLFPSRILMGYPNLYYFGMTEKGNKDAYAFNLEFAKGCVALLLTASLFVLLPISMWPLVAFMALSILQWSGFIYVTQMYADRYASMPNVFMMFFLSYITHTYFGANYNLIMTALITTYYCDLNVTMRMYPSIYDCYDYNIYWFQSGPRFRENKAARLLKDKDPMGAWEIIKGGLVLNPTDMKLNMLAAHCCLMLQDKKMVLFYLREARKNCYIGQESLLKNYEKMFFGIDIADEVEKIGNRNSKLDRKKRDEVLKIHDFLTGDEPLEKYLAREIKEKVKK